MDKQFLTGHVEKASDGGVLDVAVATDAGIDRDGEKIDPAGLDFKNFKKNPVLLWAHDYRGEVIGKVENIRKEGRRILFSPRFAVDVSIKAAQVFELYRKGFMNAFSIGFIPRKFEDKEDKEGRVIRTFTGTELLEISAVPVPSNPRAVVLARSAVKDFEGSDIEKELNEHLEEAEDKTVIPYRDEGIVQNIDAEWNAGQELKNAGDDFALIRRMSAWFDSGEPDLKGSYKLPHHQAGDLKAVWRAVSAAMAVLMGARGGVNIPEDDRRGVYNHLARHYRQFDREPPEFKLVQEQVLKDLDIEGNNTVAIHFLSVDSDEVKGLVEDVKKLKKVVANNGEDKRVKSIDTILNSPEFERKALQVVDKAIGKSLRDVNKR
jgi:HK97 family phage prohead protease